MLTVPPIRLFALDVDRTLLTSAHRLLPAVREAIMRARARGVCVVLATARSPVGLEPVLSELGGADYAICFNGGWVGRLMADPGERTRVLAEAASRWRSRDR
jgi:hydroxymethylpyrimidine pyrophosphatase-like HAD family hydrolase